IDYHCSNKKKHYLTLKDKSVDTGLSHRDLIAIYHFGKIGLSTIQEKYILRKGDLNMCNFKNKGDKLIADYSEVVHLVNNNSGNMRKACINTINSAEYSHTRMMNQLTKYGNTILFNTKGMKVSQLLFKLNEVYNYRQRDKVELVK
ncbi:MAG: hypothetical protein ACRC6E_00100, partial [Fusobacteriaceae bacterium]